MVYFIIIIYSKNFLSSIAFITAYNSPFNILLLVFSINCCLALKLIKFYLNKFSYRTCIIVNFPIIYFLTYKIIRNCNIRTNKNSGILVKNSNTIWTFFNTLCRLGFYSFANFDPIIEAVLYCQIFWKFRWDKIPWFPVRKTFYFYYDAFDSYKNYKYNFQREIFPIFY